MGQGHRMEKEKGQIKAYASPSALGGLRWQVGCHSLLLGPFLLSPRPCKQTQTPFCNFLKTSLLIQTVEMCFTIGRGAVAILERGLFESGYTSATSPLLPLTASFPDRAAFLQKDCGCPRTPRKRQPHTGMGTFQRSSHNSS